MLLLLLLLLFVHCYCCYRYDRAFYIRIDESMIAVRVQDRSKRVLTDNSDIPAFRLRNSRNADWLIDL